MNLFFGFKWIDLCKALYIRLGSANVIHVSLKKSEEGWTTATFTSVGFLVKQVHVPFITTDFSLHNQTSPCGILQVTYWGTSVCAELCKLNVDLSAIPVSLYNFFSMLWSGLISPLLQMKKLGSQGRGLPCPKPYRESQLGWPQGSCS